MTIKHWNSRKVITVREKNGRFTEKKPMFAKLSEFDKVCFALLLAITAYGNFVETVMPVAHAEDFKVYTDNQKGYCNYANDRHLIAIGHQEEFKAVCKREGVTIK